MSRRKTDTKQPNAIQLETLKAYAKWAGPEWKDQLLSDWMRAESWFPGEYAYLQQIRNLFGPIWLREFEFENVETDSTKKA